MPFDVPPPQASPLAASTSRFSTIMVLALLVTSVVFATAGQLTLKTAMNRVGRIGTAQVTAASDTILRMAKEPLLWVGLGLFGISALFWLVVLSHVPLSLAYPVVGISYIFVVGFSKLVLHEHVPTLRWLGAVVVALGIALIGLSFRRVTGS
jgi:drug/metabolite transporter (DMT)-like permease